MESLVEGVFGRAFRKQVHPVEIAKGLAKQMDENSMISVSRTYAPNDFTIHLSKSDAESIQAYQSALRDELIQYASSHARSNNYHLMTPPKVRFITEESLRFGEFGVTAKLTAGEPPRTPPPSPPRRRRGMGLRGRLWSWYWTTNRTLWKVEGRGALAAPRRTTSLSRIRTCHAGTPNSRAQRTVSLSRIWALPTAPSSTVPR